MNISEYFHIKKELKPQYINLFYMNLYSLYKKERDKRNIMFLFHCSLVIILTSIFLFLYGYNLFIGSTYSLILIIIMVVIFIPLFTLSGLLITSQKSLKKNASLTFFQSRFFEKLDNLGIKYSSDHDKNNPKFEFQEVPDTKEAKKYEEFINLIKKYMGFRNKIVIPIAYWSVGNIVFMPIILVLTPLVQLPVQVAQFFIFFNGSNFFGGIIISTFITLRERKYLIPLGANVGNWPQPVFFNSKLNEEISKLYQKI